MKIAIFLLASIAFAIAEPPVPSNRYLPNSFSSSPSGRYGAPSALSSTYGAPSGSSNYAAPGLSSSYGAPSAIQTDAVIIPNMQYQAPRLSSQYGAPGIGNNYLPPSVRYSGGYAYNDQSEPANYNFQYDVQDAEHGNDFGHAEARQGDQAEGKYSVLLPDGRRQTVEYTADADGFKPKISYEQINNGYARGYSNGGYSNGEYSNGGYTNGGYSNGGYSNGGYSNGGVYSNGAYSSGRRFNGGYSNGGVIANGGDHGYQY